MGLSWNLSLLNVLCLPPPQDVPLKQIHIRKFKPHPVHASILTLSAPQRCNAQRSDAQRNFFTSQFIPPFLQLHRCDALLCFSASPVIIFYIAHIAFPPLLPFFLSPQWLTVQNNKKFTKSHNAAMSPLATRDGHRKRKRKRSDAVH